MLKNFKTIWINNKIIRFLFVGSMTVLIDFLVYGCLFLSGMSITNSKLIGFITGTIFAYFMNKNITFKSNKKSLKIFIFFIILYTISLCLNVFTNNLFLNLLNFSNYSFIFAFCIATIFSATLNYVIMNYFLFNK